MKQGSFLQQTLRTGFFLVPLWLGFNNIVFAVDTIYLNGNIITMNDVLGTVEAVAVEVARQFEEVFECSTREVGVEELERVALEIAGPSRGG